MSQENEQDIVQRSLDVFKVPEGCEEFLYIIPSFYVAKADGKLSVKEAMAISLSSLRHEISQSLTKDQQDLFNEWSGDVMNNVVEPGDSDKLKGLVQSIEILLRRMEREAAARRLEAMYRVCVKVAAASGPMFTDKVSPEEREMLNKLFVEVVNK